MSFVSSCLFCRANWRWENSPQRQVRILTDIGALIFCETFEATSTTWSVQILDRWRCGQKVDHRRRTVIAEGVDQDEVVFVLSSASIVSLFLSHSSNFCQILWWNYSVKVQCHSLWMCTAKEDVKHEHTNSWPLVCIARHSRQQWIPRRIYKFWFGC